MSAADDTAARPTKFRVLWSGGSEEPVNAIDGDDWDSPTRGRLRKVYGEWVPIWQYNGAEDEGCNSDPCEKHGGCHCTCPCGTDQGDDCDDCVVSL